MDYVNRYNITPDKLAQQFIDEEFTTVSVDEYEEWAKGRAERLAKEANVFLAELRNGK